ncbi:D-alanine--D-alanine ligase family protein [Candidatus Cryosericum terrychapinii]|nr:D-alanine--D-alanine ligase family protein [Candidatus Cryosericum terrychapinii]
MKKRVAVVFGSRSVEHEVSIITAVQAMNTLDEEQFEVVPLYVSKESVWFTGEALKTMDVFRDLVSLPGKAQRVQLRPFAGKWTFAVQAPRRGFMSHGMDVTPLAVDVALLCNHGTNGEDGTMQGMFELLGIPYTSAGVTGSALGMDKVFQKQLFAAAGISVVPYVSFSRRTWRSSPDDCLRHAEQRLQFPMFVKPANLGSSVGITRATDHDTLRYALEVASQFDRKLLVEQAVVDHREVNCAVLGNDDPIPSACEEVFSSRAFLDYDTKYKVGYKTTAESNSGIQKAQARKVPANLGDDLTRRVQELACRAFTTLDCRGVARVDFLIDGSGAVYVNEINTIPGALSFYLWEAVGMQYRDLLTKLIDLACKAFEDRRSNVVSYDVSDLLRLGSKGKSGTKNV